MSLFDRNRPRCPYCARCGKTFQYKQVYTLEPKRYEDFEEIEDDE